MRSCRMRDQCQSKSYTKGQDCFSKYDDVAPLCPTTCGLGSTTNSGFLWQRGPFRASLDRCIDRPGILSFGLPSPLSIIFRRDSTSHYCSCSRPGCLHDMRQTDGLLPKSKPLMQRHEASETRSVLCVDSRSPSQHKTPCPHTHTHTSRQPHDHGMNYGAIASAAALITQVKVPTGAGVAGESLSQQTEPAEQNELVAARSRPSYTDSLSRRGSNAAQPDHSGSTGHRMRFLFCFAYSYTPTLVPQLFFPPLAVLSFRLGPTI